MDHSPIVVAVLVGLVAIRWVIVLVGAALVIRSAAACPACFHPTLPIQRPWLRLLGRWYEWRWCPTCAWEGLGKRERTTGIPTPVGDAFQSS